MVRSQHSPIVSRVVSSRLPPLERLVSQGRDFRPSTHIEECSIWSKLALEALRRLASSLSVGALSAAFAKLTPGRSKHFASANHSSLTETIVPPSPSLETSVHRPSAMPWGSKRVTVVPVTPEPKC